jgi:hypothetical protein
LKLDNGKEEMGMALQGRGLAQADRRRMYVQKVIFVLLTMGVFAGLAYFLLHEKQTKEQSGGVSAAKESARHKAKMDFEILQGGWVRPDGGYVVAVREIDAGGRMVAAYFNPRPINVSRAAASSDGTTIKVFIELRDINYPGATYNLTYDPRSDQLRGIYFQPAINQSFSVVFFRMK